MGGRRASLYKQGMTRNCGAETRYLGGRSDGLLSDNGGFQVPNKNPVKARPLRGFLCSRKALANKTQRRTLYQFQHRLRVNTQHEHQYRHGQ